MVGKTWPEKNKSSKDQVTRSTADDQRAAAKVTSGSALEKPRLMSHVMRNILIVLLFAVLILCQTVSGFAKMYEKPKSFSLKDKSLEKVQLKILPKVDTERLLAEDRARGKDPQHPGPHRFAVAVNVAFTLDNSGTWQTLADGRLWRLRIQSSGAKSLNLGITRFNMPDGAKLWIYDPGRKHVEGPYTSRHRSRLGSLWTPIIEGDEIVVEVFVPTGVAQPVIEITKVNHGYRGLGMEKGVPGGGTEGTCEIDVVCSPQGDPWRNQIRAVGVYTVSGTADCTGTLLNNTAFDFKPYFLSAHHCGVTDGTSGTDVSVVVYWNYQSPPGQCNTIPRGTGSTTDNQTGSTFRATYAPSDFLLLELNYFDSVHNLPIDPAFNAFYAGWDATGNTPTSTVCIHHPQCDVKAISFSDSAPQITSYFTDLPNTYHWRADWNAGVTDARGVTELGSSGSCLFETTNKRCIGQLHGGPSACGEVPANLHDFYGMFSVSWLGNGTNDTQLKHWLDPGNTGTMVLNGDPHITTANGIHYDLQGAGEFVVLRDSNGLEIQARQAPVATTNTLQDPYDNLTTCVSLNTAVAARVGSHRVTYEPNLSGVPDPSGLQLRVDGVLTTLGPTGLDLGNGGLITKTAASGGLQIEFPDGSVLLVTPNWWASQSKWYLNIDIVRPKATDGAAPGSFPAGGIAGAVTPGSWLPALPDGTSMGPMPGSLHQRYVDLYQKFANAWHVTDETSLFDYAPGTSTDTFTMRNWPSENLPCVIAGAQPVLQTSQAVAQQGCRQVTDKNAHANCVFDVMVTGHQGFSRAYVLSQRIKANSTITRVSYDKYPMKIEEPVTFTVTVARIALTGKGVPTGTVQFTLDGNKVGKPVQLNAKGQATLKTSGLKPGEHKVSAIYIPSKGSAFLPSNSPDHILPARGKNE